MHNENLAAPHIVTQAGEDAASQAEHRDGAAAPAVGGERDSRWGIEFCTEIRTDGPTSSGPTA